MISLDTLRQPFCLCLGLAHGQCLLLLASILLLNLLRLLGGLLDEGQEFGLTRDVSSEHLRHNQTLLGLVVFEDTAKCSLSGTECLGNLLAIFFHV